MWEVSGPGPLRSRAHAWGQGSVGTRGFFSRDRTMTSHSHRMQRTSRGWAGTALSQKGRSEELSQGGSLVRPIALTSHPHNNRVELDAVGVEMAWETRSLTLDSLQSHQPQTGAVYIFLSLRSLFKFLIVFSSPKGSSVGH